MKPKVIVVIEGGLVQDILTDTDQVEVLVIDYDTEGGDEDRIVSIPQGEYPDDDAYVFDSDLSVDPDRVEELYKIITQ